MSTIYGGGYDQPGYAPPRRVNYNWIGESWNLFSAHAGVWIVGILLYGILEQVIIFVLNHLFPNPAYIAPPGPFGPGSFSFRNYAGYGTNSTLTPMGQGISLLINWAFISFESASLYHLAVKQVRGEKTSFGDLLSGGPYFVQMLVFNLILVVASLAGCLLFCVGVFVVWGLLLPGFAMVADGVGAMEAISRSINAMKNDWLNAALFVFVFAMLILVSLIPCFLGAFVTVPMIHIASALAYRDMVGMPGIAAPAGPYYGAPQAGTWPPPPGQFQTPPPPTWGQQPMQPPPPTENPTEGGPPTE